MSVMTFLIVAALSCVVASLGLGVTAMVRNGVVAHRTSEQWMTMRVAFQALAVALIILALWT